MGRAGRKDAGAEEAFELEKSRRWDEYFQEEQQKPLKWVKHDVDASDDERLQDLRDEHGFEALGRWWMLVEKLAGRKCHRYDVGRPNGWRRLAHELEFDSVDECREFVSWLIGYGLLSRESFDEFAHIASPRIDRNAAASAKDQADRRIGTWIRECKRAG